ncbi:flagellar protein FlhE [Candidatus Pantoea formicae]|uniref:flagellar protein FlhE n=1 Tax=Candidatus Pantoea formicae TaxID=2608355 RepID=UPI003EDB20B1
MRGWMWCGLLVMSPLAMAADGSWSSSSFGGMLSQGKQTLKSRPVQPDIAPPPGAIAATLAWRITTDGNVPMGFRVQVCGGNRCVRLSGLSGEMALPADFPAGGPLWFEYVSTVRGVIAPSVTILSNQVTLGYRVR